MSLECFEDGGEVLSDVGSGRSKVVSGGKPECAVVEACDMGRAPTNTLYDATSMQRKISRMGRKKKEEFCEKMLG